MRIVIALGGNALLKRGEPMTAGRQRANVRVAAAALARVAADHELVISHGNGPQVGLLALQGAAYKDVDAYPLDVLGAETQGMIGYMVEQEVGNLLPFDRPLATLLTMVEVDPDDPAFADPTKFVGPIYDEATAKSLAAEKGWDVKPDGASWRRVVPSPRPQADLRDPADALAPGAGHGRHLRRRRGHPDDVRPGRRPPARRRRGGHRQGPRDQPAGARARGGSVRDGDRRRRRLPRFRAADPGAHRPGDPGRARCDGPAGRLDGTEGRRRDRIRDRHRKAGGDRIARGHRRAGRRQRRDTGHGGITRR